MESKPPRKDDRRADGNGSLKDIIIEAGLPADIAAEFADVFGDDRQSASPNTGSWSKKQITMVMAASGVMAFNVMALISLFPVLRGRGAPYLPTKRNNLDRMFAQLHSNDDFRKMATDISKGRPKFVDLGSGDGRVVFRAAREDVFSSCDGFEINPMLHGFAQLRKLLTPKYWKLTQFHLGDIWKVDLADVDVVAVYGLSPMMKDLGIKLQNELKPGAFVLSNVFAIPNWTPVETSHSGTHIYRMPISKQSENKA